MKCKKPKSADDANSLQRGTRHAMGALEFMIQNSFAPKDLEITVIKNVKRSIVGEDLKGLLFLASRRWPF